MAQQPLTAFRTGLAAVDRNLDLLMSKLNPVVSAVSTLGNTPAWTKLTLQSNISDYSTSDGSYPTCAYYKDANNVVWLRGHVWNNTGGGLATPTFFVLPAGYRPLYTRAFAVRCNSGGETFYNILLASSGAMIGASTLGGGGIVSIDISFQAEQ